MKSLYEKTKDAVEALKAAEREYPGGGLAGSVTVNEDDLDLVIMFCDAAFNDGYQPSGRNRRGMNSDAANEIRGIENAEV